MLSLRAANVLLIGGGKEREKQKCDSSTYFVYKQQVDFVGFPINFRSIVDLRNVHRSMKLPLRAASVLLIGGGGKEREKQKMELYEKLETKNEKWGPISEGKQRCNLSAYFV